MSVSHNARLRRRVKSLEEQRRKAEELLRPLLGHSYLPCEPSPSGKNRWRCAACGHVSVGPMYTIYEQCPENEVFRLRSQLGLAWRTK